MSDRSISHDGPDRDHFTVTVSITKTVVTTQGSGRQRRVEQIANFTARGRTLEEAKGVSGQMSRAIVDMDESVTDEEPKYPGPHVRFD